MDNYSVRLVIVVALKDTSTVIIYNYTITYKGVLVGRFWLRVKKGDFDRFRIYSHDQRQSSSKMFSFDRLKRMPWVLFQSIVL